MDTSSPKLARFLAAQDRVEAATAELKEVEDRARRLRMEVNIAHNELADAKKDLEQLDRPEGEEQPVPDPSPPSAPAPASSAPMRTKRKKRWRPGEPLPSNFQEVLEALPANDILNHAQLRAKLPGLSDHVIRSRIGKCKQCGLIDSAGWGLYRLSETAKRALQRSLCVVE